VGGAAEAVEAGGSLGPQATGRRRRGIRSRGFMA
jgi:hypothetical protein